MLGKTLWFSARWWWAGRWAPAIPILANSSLASAPEAVHETWASGFEGRAVAIGHAIVLVRVRLPLRSSHCCRLGTTHAFGLTSSRWWT